MSKKTWIIFIAIVVAVLAGLIIYSRAANPSIDVSGVDANAIIAASDQNGQIGDHVSGNPNSSVVIVEYGDFQCPSCAGAHPQVKAVLQEYSDRVAFIFRNFPLTSIHPNARAASAAAEAAGLQDNYWAMHDTLFETQNEWQFLSGNERNDKFTSYAVALGLDEARFRADLAASTVNSKISFDQAIARKVGVEATPTFYINGNLVDKTASSALVQGDAEAFTALIDSYLAQ
jgi:protein-disulfide isomerase